MQKKYSLVPTKTFLKSLNKIDYKQQRHILSKLEALKEDPLGQGKKPAGKKFGIWRMKAGEYRIRYDIDGNSIILLLVKHRKDIYRER